MGRRGVSPIEIHEVLARIAASDAERSNPQRLDTVVGYRNGNWIYEWIHQGMQWQQRATEQQDPLLGGEYWLKAASLYSIAGYPHLKGDELAEQAEMLANRAYEEAALLLPYQLKELEFRIEGGGSVTGFLHMPEKGEAPFPTVLMCGSLDTLQTDYHRLFRDYRAARHRHADARHAVDRFLLQMEADAGLQLPAPTGADPAGLGAVGGPSAGERLWLPLRRQRGGAIGLPGAAAAARRGLPGPVVHRLLCDSSTQLNVPDMYMDVLASRMGMANASDNVLKVELNSYSLKMQGLLGRRCPTPMISGYWERDTLSPKEESQLIVTSSVSGKLVAIPRTPVYDSFHRALLQMSGWLKDKMR